MPHAKAYSISAGRGRRSVTPTVLAETYDVLEEVAADFECSVTNLVEFIIVDWLRESMGRDVENRPNERCADIYVQSEGGKRRRCSKFALPDSRYCAWHQPKADGAPSTGA